MKTTTPAEQLLDALLQKQQADGLNDAALARKLGISKSLLSLIKSGKQEPTMKAVRGILRAYPGLAPLVHIFLASESMIPNDGEQHQSRRTAR